MHDLVTLSVFLPIMWHREDEAIGRWNQGKSPGEKAAGGRSSQRACLWDTTQSSGKYATEEYKCFAIGITLLESGDNTFVIEWFAGINCIIVWSQI